MRPGRARRAVVVSSLHRSSRSFLSFAVRFFVDRMSLLAVVGLWHIATNFSLGPDVSFRGEAEVG
jgi:hypothetical protein